MPKLAQLFHMYAYICSTPSLLTKIALCEGPTEGRTDRGMDGRMDGQSLF